MTSNMPHMIEPICSKQKPLLQNTENILMNGFVFHGHIAFPSKSNALNFNISTHPIRLAKPYE